MAKKKIDIDKYASGLFGRTEEYADKVRQHYAAAVEELLKLAAGRDTGSSGTFSFSDNKKLSEKANNVLRGLYSSVYNEIKGGVKAEWEYANLSCDALIESIFGKGLQEDNHFARWFSRNQDAMDAFFKRKSAYGGLNLSQYVWKYTGDLKKEMELALTLSLGKGDSAATVSRHVRQFLQEPDSMFRRFRVKVGEKKIYDEEGNVIDTQPVYGRRWKRKVTDPLTGAVTWENFSPRNYHPGQGVYRSSYKNAMRLTRTEVNMAYRTAEQDRWQRLDFVIGYEIKTSNNHPAPDICDDLKGKYPKDFVFKGWHPQCRCKCIPLLATEDEFVAMQQALLDGKSAPRPKNTIRKPNDDFYKWVEANKERMETATSMPYWVQDNQDYINGKKKIRTKTEEEREAIRKRWAERAKKNQQIIKMANNVVKVAQYYPEIDLSKLQGYIDAKQVSLANTEARAIAKEVAAIKKDEKALSVLIPNVHEWKKQFTSTELHGVYDAVEQKLNKWTGLSLQDQAKKLDFEAYKYIGGNMNNVQQKYKTWQVSQAAYIKKLASVQDLIEWEDIDKVLKEAKAFKTKSQPYLALISQLEDAISQHNKADAQSIVGDMNAKRAALKKAADARRKKNNKSIFGADAYTEERKNAAVWLKSATESHNKWDALSEDIWNDANAAEKKGWRDYTGGSGHMNRPLRGYDGGWGWRYYKGVGKVALDNERGETNIRALQALIDRHASTEDIWLQRGIETWDGVEGLIGKQNLTPKELESMVGSEVVDWSFGSCGSAKGTGFRGTIFNIYCPKGTKMIYASPHSCFYSENETILQLGTRFRITKVEVVSQYEIYVDMEVIGYETHPLL